jgi:hypothetical protein
MRDTYKLRSWNTTWRIVREYGPDILKLISLTEAGLQIPNFMLMMGGNTKEVGGETPEDEIDEVPM